MIEFFASDRVPLLRVVVFLLAFLCLDVLFAENWPAWRGPRGDGISTETDLPVHWSRDKNIRWRVDLPEPGNSTPIVWGDRVFLTQPMEKGQRRTLLCLDRRSGERLWQSGVTAKVMEPTHETNLYCSPSPVTDGERVIAWFGTIGLVAFDFDGKELWRRPLGKLDHIFGYGSSPVIHGDLCFLNFGPGTEEFGVAVNKASGEIVWKYDLPGPEDDPQRQPPDKDIYGTWSTPIVARHGDRDELIFCVRHQILAVDPATGKKLWSCSELGPQMKASPVAGDGVVVALGGKDSSTLAVRLGGKGEVTESHLLWKRPATSRLGTGVIYKGHFYANRRNGVVECIELESGKSIWQERHRGKGSDTWSSLFLAGGKIYAINQAADTFVIKASPKYELLATNSLDDHTNSSLIGSQGNIFIRTHKALWCIGEEQKAAN